jgi:hypothetical protein
VRLAEDVYIDPRAGHLQERVDEAFNRSNGTS